MTNIDPKTWRAARRALEKALALHLDDPNVSLIDLGFRTRSSAQHRLEPELTVRVHVCRKLYGHAFQDFATEEPDRVIEAQRIGFAVDIPEADYHLQLPQPAPVRAATQVVIPHLGMRVIKSGTGATAGIITGILGYSIRRDGDSKHLIGPLVHIASDEEYEKTPAADDSDAWWLECSTRRAVALHIAGSNHPNFGLALSTPEILNAPEVNTVMKSTPPAEAVDTCPPASPEQLETTVAGSIGALFSRLAANLFSPILQAGLLMVMGILIMGFNQHLLKAHRQQQEKTDQLKFQLQHLETAVRVDSLRQQQIRRVLSIINRFNPVMTEELKADVAAEIYEMSLKYRELTVELICATITHETGRTWSPEAISHAGAMGLMQILPTTGMFLAREEGLTWTSAEEMLFNPILNIRFGCRYLAMLVTDYGMEAGLAAYNGGEKQARLWLRGRTANALLHKETAYYVPAILKIYKEYRNLL
ncbi:MAG: lytic transglycosylase domain-containing protein [candidate division KSB1 bacterium]|nr:lytic transglycosylase domain-containing protein [candidate division KSB1 bacterium]MDZ7301295.1 lytic transglycosylase domain-containing protein [candidate division KSB1 bacterium]MDZ7310820.1 lytic transglycosylase domain-containing protein [candidate division KSB1 bacterium]